MAKRISLRRPAAERLTRTWESRSIRVAGHGTRSASGLLRCSPQPATHHLRWTCRASSAATGQPGRATELIALEMGESQLAQDIHSLRTFQTLGDCRDTSVARGRFREAPLAMLP